jgi:hypothetical protein
MGRGTVEQGGDLIDRLLGPDDDEEVSGLQTEIRSR